MSDDTDSDDQQSHRIRSTSPIAVKWQELLDAFLFVNAAQVGENSASISSVTGQIRLHSPWTDLWGESEEESREAADADDKMLAIPHKTELGLGRDLVLLFVDEIIPDSYDEVAHFFQKRGAYANFKGLLAEQGLLQDWYDFEKLAEEQSLRNWCSDNAVTILEDNS